MEPVENTAPPFGVSKNTMSARTRGVVLTPDGKVHVPDVLVDVQVGVGVLLRGREVERVRRGAVIAIEGVQLDAGGAAADQAEVTDELLGAHALEDEGGTRVEAVGIAPVVR